MRQGSPLCLGGTDGVNTLSNAVQRPFHDCAGVAHVNRTALIEFVLPSRLQGEDACEGRCGIADRITLHAHRIRFRVCLRWNCSSGLRHVGIEGFLVEERNAGQIADIITTIESGEVDLASMRVAARAKIEREFDNSELDTRLEQIAFTLAGIVPATEPVRVAEAVS